VAVGMVAGRVVLLSGWNVMGVRLDPMTTGLSISPMGSFLIEGDGTGRKMPLRRA
jgi:hypothetical protein